ncbi:hypothetical protein D3C87_95740 [compost metagenome]
MPPYYDIYGLSAKRDKETIERFLEHFTHRDLIEDREGQEIFVMSNEKYGQEDFSIPVKTLSEVIQFGIDYPDVGFCFYIGTRSNLKSGIGDVLLKFTFDAKVIFGVAIEDNTLLEDGSQASNFPNAVKIKEQIEALTEAYKSSIQFEYAPADSEEEFDADIEIWKNLTNGSIA